jgi:hypothetical protein
VEPIFEQILAFNLFATTVVFYVAAKMYLFPRLNELQPRQILIPIFLLHSLRHLGLMFLAPGAVYPGMPPQFAYPAALGDLLTALLAIVAIPAVAHDWKSGRLWVWLFNVVGSVDLAQAIILATIYGAANFMGSAYWIPAFWVPALLVTHYVVFVVMVRTSKVGEKMKAEVPWGLREKMP